MYHQRWHRVHRTLEDEEIKARRAKIKQEIQSLVKEALGELAPGPGLHTQQLQWDELPLEGPGVLCSYLTKRLSTLQGVINSPITKDFKRGNCVIKADVRNTYLTNLLKPELGEPVALQQFVNTAWPHVQNFGWVRDCKISLTSEVEWLSQQQQH